MNPWHDVALGERPEERFQAVIEIPRGSKNKYELDKRTGLLRLDRVLYSAVVYPANYGFLPRTYCDDGDPLDVLVLCQEAIPPLCLVTCKPIGLIRMSDEMGRDDKLIAVAVDDPEFDHYADVSELPPHRRRELEQFLRDYKTLEKKKVAVEPMRGRAEVAEVIREAIALYDEKIGPTWGGSRG